MGLISQLKEEHKQIIYSFETVQSSIKDEKTESVDLANSFKELRDVLVAHLKLEDELLYPKLLETKDEKANDLGKKFADEMLKISKIAMDFFGKYEKIEVSKLREDSEFNEMLNIVIETVKKRIETEENILFPAYEKCCE